MEQIVSFRITPPDTDQLCPQVSRALEKRTERVSRQEYPKMWELIDKLNGVEKAPFAVRENRRKRRAFLGAWEWAMGLFLLIPGCMDPKELLVPLMIGTFCYGIGAVSLWRNKRTLLGVLSLIQGGFLSLCVLRGRIPGGMGLLVPAVAGIIIGIAALLRRKREKESPYDRAARQLLQGRASLSGIEAVRVSFTKEGLAVEQEDGCEEERQIVPYADFECVLETEDLLLPIYRDSVMVLQKKDLCTGDLSGLKEFLSGQIQYVPVMAQAEG